MFNNDYLKDKIINLVINNWNKNTSPSEYNERHNKIYKVLNIINDYPNKICIEDIINELIIDKDLELYNIFSYLAPTPLKLNILRYLACISYTDIQCFILAYIILNDLIKTEKKNPNQYFNNTRISPLDNLMSLKNNIYKNYKTPERTL